MKRPFSWRIVCCVVFVMSLAGCGGADPASYTPVADSAKQALEASLAAWKDGKKPADIGALASGPAVQIVDSDWLAGKKLKSYTIESESTPAEASPDSVARQFAVKLEFDSGAPQSVVYHIVGKDPLLVFRDKDFTQQSGM